jgi:hypothetical protein
MIIIHGILLIKDLKDNKLKIIIAKRPKNTDYYPNFFSITFEEQMTRLYSTRDRQLHGGSPITRQITKGDMSFRSCFSRGVFEELGLEISPEKVHILSFGREYYNFNFGVIALYEIRGYYFKNFKNFSRSIFHIHLKNRAKELIRRAEKGQLENSDSIGRVKTARKNIEEIIQQEIYSKMGAAEWKIAYDRYYNELHTLVYNHEGINGDIVPNQINPEDTTIEDILGKLYAKNFSLKNLKDLFKKEFLQTSKHHPTSRARFLLTVAYYYGVKISQQLIYDCYYGNE